MNFFISDKSRFNRLPYVLAAFLLAILFDQFFWHRVIGLGAFLFVVIYVIVFTGLSFYYHHIKNRSVLWLLIPILVLAFNQMLYTNLLIRELVPFIIFVLLIFYSILLTLRNDNKIAFYFKNIPIFRNVFIIFKNCSTFLKDLFSWTKKGKNSEIYKQIAIGIIVALPILAIFTSLFANADKVFGESLENIFSFNININEELLFRFIRVVVLTFLASIFFYTLINEGHILIDKKKPAINVSSLTTGIVLGLVNILFAIFVFIQIKYLFGSHDFIISQHIVFAEYARSGFFQLVWVMIFSLLLILFFYQSAWQHGTTALVKFLKAFLIIQVLVVAISALKRMNLYQDEYGYTTLRLYVEWFIYFICAMFLSLFVSIIKNYSFKKVFYGGIIGGVVAFMLISSVNVDRIIAKKNISRYLTQDKNLDLRYLFLLSDDAIPEILTLANSEIKTEKIVGIYFKANEDKAKRTKEWYNDRLKIEKNKILIEREHWYLFNIGAQRALNLLNK